jgi:DNA-directed RNA polymerase subunit RPC12/RpoP
MGASPTLLRRKPKLSSIYRDLGYSTEPNYQCVECSARVVVTDPHALRDIAAGDARPVCQACNNQRLNLAVSAELAECILVDRGE